MGHRLNLQTEFETLLGNRNVYFQPPESKKLVYDCIIYRKVDIASNYANNMNYKNDNHYEVTLIYRDPDSTLPEELLRHFQYCRTKSYFVKDNLHHNVFDLFY